MTFFLIDARENPYIIEFSRVTKIGSDEPFALMEYMIWIHQMHSDFRRMTGWAETPGEPEYQEAFIQWLKTKEAIK